MKDYRLTRGSAAVEFAIVLPFMMALLAVIVEFGRGYSLRVSLTNAAREGARYAASYPTDSAGIIERVKQELTGSNVKNVSVMVSPTTRTAGKPVTVTVYYIWKPILGRFLGFFQGVEESNWIGWWGSGWKAIRIGDQTLAVDSSNRPRWISPAGVLRVEPWYAWWNPSDSKVFFDYGGPNQQEFKVGWQLITATATMMVIQ